MTSDEAAPSGNRSMLERIDQWQRQHGTVGFPLGVLYKFLDDQGGYLAALIAYYAFLSLFPLLLLLVTILGYLLADNPALQQQIVTSTLSQFPIIGDELRQNIHLLHGNAYAVAVGILGSLYGGIGVA